jgi:hypothetical protein
VVSESFELGDQPAAMCLDVALDLASPGQALVALVVYEHPIGRDED